MQNISSSTPTKKYDGIVIDADPDKRMRFKAISHASGMFDELILVPDFRTALSRLSRGRERIVIFVGEDTSPDALPRFIQEAKASACGQDSAYVLSVKPHHTDDRTIAGATLKGMDSILAEPFSVDGLTSVTSLAATVHAGRRKARLQAAMKLLAKSTLDRIDQVSTAKALEREPGEAARELRLCHDEIRALEPELIAFFVGEILEQSEHRPVPAELAVHLAAEQMREARAAERVARKMEACGMDDAARAMLNQSRIIKR